MFMPTDQEMSLYQQIKKHVYANGSRNVFMPTDQETFLSQHIKKQL